MVTLPHGKGSILGKLAVRHGKRQLSLLLGTGHHGDPGGVDCLQRNVRCKARGIELRPGTVAALLFRHLRQLHQPQILSILEGNLSNHILSGFERQGKGDEFRGNPLFLAKGRKLHRLCFSGVTDPVNGRQPRIHKAVALDASFFQISVTCHRAQILCAFFHRGNGAVV